MTCQHIRTEDIQLADHRQRVCVDCHQAWREWPIRMTDEEYDSCLLLMAAYLLSEATKGST